MQTKIHPAKKEIEGREKATAEIGMGMGMGMAGEGGKTQRGIPVPYPRGDQLIRGVTHSLRRRLGRHSMTRLTDRLMVGDCVCVYIG